jgi:hypothetical protein
VYISGEHVEQNWPDMKNCCPKAALISFSVGVRFAGCILYTHAEQIHASKHFLRLAGAEMVPPRIAFWRAREINSRNLAPRNAYLIHTVRLNDVKLKS